MGVMALTRPERLFPLIRHISYPASRALARLPITPNQITLASLVAALLAAWGYMQGTYGWAVAGGLALSVSYLLDNADGEVARLKGMQSRFGEYFDTFVDWLAHAAFFVGLGMGVRAAGGGDIWLWMGGIAAAGGTINYGLGIYLDRRQGDSADKAPDQPTTPEIRGLADWLVYAFRELSRADFCFIALALSLADLHWLLLPAGAIGAQVYWLTAFVRGARRHHV